MRRLLPDRVGPYTRALLVAGVLLAGGGAGATHPPLALDTKRVPLADNLAVGERVGRFKFLGMLEIPSIVINGVQLSQLSDLAWDENAGVLYALSDKGAVFYLHPIFDNDALVDVRLSRAVPLRELDSGRPLRDKRADAEGLALVRRTNGRRLDVEWVVSFERFPRIVRYRTDGYAIAQRRLPPPLADAKVYSSGNRMLESVCRDPRHGLLTMPEKPLRLEASGYNRLYSTNGASWRYPLPDDDRVVSLACRGAGEVLVLETSFGIQFWRSRVSVKRVHLNQSPSADAVLDAETLFTLGTADGYQIDNFEGIAHHRGNRFFLVSDDNDFFLQRTLLLYFELLDE